MHDLNPISRRLAILAAVAAVALLGGAARYPGTYSPADAAKLDKLSAYLNGIRTLKSNFVQLSPDGDMAQGEFSLSRPGKLRFAYNPPSPVLIVATEGSIYVKNSRLNTVDRTSLSDTPLDILLNNDVDLRHNPAVTGIEEQPGSLIVRARANTTRSQSNITLVFSYPGIGNLAIGAVIQRDLPLIQGLVLTFACLFIITNLLVDLSYTLLNPKVRHA